MRIRWTEEELSTLEDMAQMYTVKQIAFRLKRRGYKRTETAICYCSSQDIDTFVSKIVKDYIEYDFHTHFSF